MVFVSVCVCVSLSVNVCLCRAVYVCHCLGGCIADMTKYCRWRLWMFFPDGGCIFYQDHQKPSREKHQYTDCVCALGVTAVDRCKALLVLDICELREEAAAGDFLHVTDDMLVPTNLGEELLAYLAVVTCHRQDVALSFW